MARLCLESDLQGKEKKNKDKQLQHWEISRRYETMKILWWWPEMHSTGSGLNNNPNITHTAVMWTNLVFFLLYQIILLLSLNWCELSLHARLIYIRQKQEGRGMFSLLLYGNDWGITHKQQTCTGCNVLMLTSKIYCMLHGAVHSLCPLHYLEYTNQQRCFSLLSEHTGDLHLSN